MSIVTNSPTHSSCINGGFVAHCDADQESHNRDEFQTVTVRQKVDIAQGSTLEGTVGQNLEASVEEECTHPGSSEDMSIRCGQNLDGEYGITFGYIHKGLRINDEEISRLRNTNMKNLLCRKKLYLVLDLDHTSLNSAFICLLRSEELHLLTQTDSLDDVSNGSLFKFNNLPKLTKLRPFVRTFLKEASEMFEMYIYTLGGREYARDVVKLLDPRGEYFNGKVTSQDDGTETDQKSLDVVPGHESAVLILDDTKHVWMKHTDNLIQIEKYLFLLLVVGRIV